MTTVAETPPPAEPSTVLLLSADTPELLDVAPLARRGTTETLWALQVDSAVTLRGILATEAQMVGLRNLLDNALGQIGGNE